MTTHEPDQEVWITLRFKGSVPLSVDAHQAVATLVRRIEAHLLHGSEAPKPSLWHRLFNRRVTRRDFSLCQPVELIEVEEETDIYNTT